MSLYMVFFLGWALGICVVFGVAYAMYRKYK